MITKTSCVAAGDIFISRRLPERRYEGFEAFRDLVLEHEVRFANLEILFLDKEGYPGSSTGTYAMGPPAAIEDVKALGFNLFNTANNHALDFSHNGLMAHLGHLREQDILHTGAGQNLAEASAPVYLEGANARIGLIGVCSTLGNNLPAGIQRGDMLGRPGVNPLGFETLYHLSAEKLEQLKAIAKDTHINVSHENYVRAGFQIAPKEGYYFGGNIFVESDTPGMVTRPLERDMERIIKSIHEMRRQADFAIVSIHSHESIPTDGTPAEFMRDFCRRCIDEGANAVVGHGSHRVRGVELYGGGVIFYSLGNVLFENDTVHLHPADFYQHYSLPTDSQVGEGLDARERSGAVAREKSGLTGQSAMPRGPGIYETVLAAWDMEDGRVQNIRLYPVEMGVNLPRYRRGLPALTNDVMTLEYMRGLSKEFNTDIEIKDGVGYVKPL